MNKNFLLLPLLSLVLGLAACDDTDKKNYTGDGDNGSGNLPGGSDTLNPNGDNAGSGIVENGRPPGNFNPDTDVDYNSLDSDTVYFAFDSSSIPAQEQGKLSAVADWMKANPGHTLFLAGHADKRGTPEYNRALGERRAQAVREYLVGLGLSASALYTNSYGSDRPAVDGDTEEDYAKNRRVQVGVITKQ